MPYFHMWETVTDRELGQSGPDGYLTNATKQGSETASWQSILYSVMELQPQCVFVLKGTLDFFPPRPLLCLGQCRPSSAQCSLEHACVKGFSLLENHSKYVLLCAEASVYNRNMFTREQTK